MLHIVSCYIYLSKLLKCKEEADFEAEHDIMALTMDEHGLVVIFIQVGT